jgi:hypothetical protein
MNAKINRCLLWLVPLVLVSACGYDNYDSPQAKLHGKIVYKGKPVHVQSQQVTFRLYQTGFKEHSPITVDVAPDGSYHALLFDGNYQLIFPSGQGPFIQNTESDTLVIKVKGNTGQNIMVLPYYMINDPKFSISDSTASADFSLNQIITDNRAKDIQFVTLYIGKTRFTNDQNNVASEQINGSQITNMNSIELSAKVPKLTPNQSYVYAHIGVKIQDVEDMLFSRVKKLQLK